MLANASGKIVVKASVAYLKPYNRSSSQENAESRLIVADNEGVGQRRRVNSELRESAESAIPPRDQLPAALASASSIDAFDATCTEAIYFTSQSSPSRCCSHDTDRPPPYPGVCWNCWAFEHEYSACPERRRRFCRGCGYTDRTLANCPRCAKKYFDRQGRRGKMDPVQGPKDAAGLPRSYQVHFQDFPYTK